MFTYKDINHFSKAEFSTLVAEREGPCVSFFLPLSAWRGHEGQAAPLHLRALVAQAEQQLLARGLPAAAIERLLTPVTTLAAPHREVWTPQPHSLALFVAPDCFLFYRLPLPLSERVIVDRRFYIVPLVPLVDGEDCFYTLALSQNAVRLFQGARYQMTEIELTDAPTSLADLLRYDEVERSLQLHTSGSSTGRGPSPAIFHGQGVSGDEKVVHANLLRFFHAVERAVTARLLKERAPLVLAGVAVDQGLYRKINRYPCLETHGIPGNPDKLTADALHGPAWAIVEPYFQQAPERALMRYRQGAGQGDGHTVSDIQNVVLTAAYHQVDSLFTTLSCQIWGRFIADSHQVILHKTAEAGDEELVNLAVIHTLSSQGAAYLVEPKQLPTGVTVAAILRQ